MTTLTDYRSASAPRTAPSADFTIVGLWSLLGLIVSAALIMAGFAGDFSVLAAFAG